VLEIGEDAVPTAKQILKALGAGEMVVEDLDSSVAALFDGDAAPASDSDVVSAAPVSQ
jgi:hypothetical protein